MDLLSVFHKYRLKYAVAVLTMLLLAAVGLHASVYRTFTPENIRSRLQQSIAHTHRKISFDADIRRRLLPRPTVILKNLTITEPDGGRVAVSVKETKIGLSWKNLWSDRIQVEKWVVSGADLALTRDRNGAWNIQDLFDGAKHSASVNRIIVENSTVRLNFLQQQLILKEISLNLQSPDSSGQQFESSGILVWRKLSVPWKSRGLFLSDGIGTPEISPFHFEASTSLDGHGITISTTGSPSVRFNAGGADAAGLGLRADTSFRNLHLTAQIPALALKNNSIKTGTVNGTFTAGGEYARWDGSFKLDKANLHSGIANIGNAEISGSFKTPRLQTNFSLGSPLVWSRDNGLDAPRLHISTLQDTVDRLPQPRFISRLDGSLSIPNLQNWNAELNGTFDRQPVAAKFKYTREGAPRLEAAAALQKLNLAPYLDEFRQQNGKIFPDILGRLSGNVEAHLKIGSIQLPGLQLDDMETYLHADKDHIALSRFKSGLYGGHTEGGISIANTRPATYRLQQNASNIQIQPLLQDLFGFHSFSGNGDAVIDLTASGENRKQLIRSLQGSLSLNISNGAWHGIDMDSILKNGLSGKISGSTPFYRFTLNSEISDGISRHIDTELFSDSLYVTSNGYTNLDTQELSEDVLIRNAVHPKNKPIPLKITGTVDKPSITVDYGRLTGGINSRKEKQKILEDTLLEQWQWLKPKEP
ncbi:TPA: AsmA family protein [Neisseria gonorrhoeae]|uniref:AsmA family protein n=1 Tax=Neisseria gonorrhoeae TaxID=485 RepID=UPI0005E28C85|nr:AsmA family protein [Neisseria gonorrhoeae]KLS26238.1 asmA family protein [Neisseria gonorrhoeae MIA_2011_05-10]KLS31837.1 asmA family protein [Neisseria gonorrhoeae ALB_2011_03_03]KLS36186.1 asmA family protein [Neisseria gonorrhoeae ATL_2011_01_03]KLS39310.1 asmA family protein [Neisseria gonorrhoeae ATL_2011_01_05]KLS76464.1 asmA family protein [Neisseria gonorrhoeae MU_NG18]